MKTFHKNTGIIKFQWGPVPPEKQIFSLCGLTDIQSKRDIENFVPLIF
jgi:hypothetical protein